MLSSTPPTRPTLHLSERDQARFWAKVALPNEQGCMLWLAYVDPHGYGRFALSGNAAKAHHVSYVLAYGPIPDGLVIDHVLANGCTNRHCVAPLHLEAVTQRENLLRGKGFAGAHAGRTHCPQGHEYVEANTYTDPKRRRYCRTCRQARDRKQDPATYTYDPLSRRTP